MTVEPTAFVAAMRAHWSTTLNNVSSPNLEAVWRQMATTFNRQISTFGTPEGDRWKVLQPATGTGKSQGLAVYCSMLADVDHPGVLIVTRLKAQADEIAETINKLAGREITIAYHGDNRVPVATLSSFPVLVITHRAYEIGLDAINQGRQYASNWDSYHQWAGGKRKLTVIDEALDIIEEAQVDLDKVRVVKGVIPFEIAEKFPAQMQAIDTVEQVLVEIARMAKARKEQVGKEQERILRGADTIMPMPSEYDMTPLRRAMQSARLDWKLLRRTDLDGNKRLIKHYDTILRDINTTLANWSWYAKKLNDHTINTARLIVPEDISGAVILDATASANLIYRLFGDRVDVVPVPSRARTYANVNLHVSFGHAVGKTSMLRTIKQEGPKLIANLQEQLGKARKVFVCCHKWVAPHLIAYDTGFTAFDVGHWGAVDGRNDWQDFDTAVIFGLPYRDRAWSANTFMALCGPQTTDWLNSEGDRPFQSYQDIRHSLEVGQLVVSIVQAMNRTRNRKVIDEHGNCHPVDVFILLPADKSGREILDGITGEMPGINIIPWTYTAAKTKPRRSNHEEAVVRYAGVMPNGRKSVTDIRSELGIPSTTWERLGISMRDTTSALAKRLVAQGVVYRVEQAGKVRRGYLVKND
jgi:hypothetical protein